MRKKRAEFKARGLNSLGDPYKLMRHPELHGLRNHNLYCKLRLVKLERMAK